MVFYYCSTKKFLSTIALANCNLAIAGEGFLASDFDNQYYS
jgi:hypothetical protein